jgi:hypothetical protein
VAEAVDLDDAFDRCHELWAPGVVTRVQRRRRADRHGSTVTSRGACITDGCFLCPTGRFSIVMRDRTVESGPPATRSPCGGASSTSPTPHRFLVLEPAGGDGDDHGHITHLRTTHGTGLG